MPKKHNLYQFMFNTGKWKASSGVTLMTSSQRGIYIELLCSAWVQDDTGLPTDEISLKKLARPDSDAQWAEDWPIVKQEFYEENGKLYNETLRELFTHSLSRYEASIENSNKPPKEGKQPRGRPRNNLEENLDNNLTPKLQKTQPTAYSLQPTDHNSQTPIAVGDVISGSLTSFPDPIKTLEDRYRAIVGESGWSRSKNWFKWFLEVVPVSSDALDAIKYVEDRIDPEIRESKGCGSEPKDPAGMLVSKMQEILKKYKITNMSHKEANYWVSNWKQEKG